MTAMGDMLAGWERATADLVRAFSVAVPPTPPVVRRRRAALLRAYRRARR